MGGVVQVQQGVLVPVLLSDGIDDQPAARRQDPQRLDNRTPGGGKVYRGVGDMPAGGSSPVAPAQSAASRFAIS